MYWVTGLLGLALAAAPFVFGYSSDALALWTSLLIGGVVIVASIREGIASDKERWEYWVAAILGVGTVLAPFILGFSGNTPAVTTSVIVGVILAILAGTKLTARLEG